MNKYYEKHREVILQRRRDSRRLKTAFEPNKPSGPEYWLIPEFIYNPLNQKYKFDFDPCPYPKPAGYNSLSSEVKWGKMNWVNPPFKLRDAPYGGIAKFVDRAILEKKKGNKSVFILPCSVGIGKLIAAGGTVISAQQVNFLEKNTKKPSPAKYWQLIIEL